MSNLLIVVEHIVRFSGVVFANVFCCLPSLFVFIFFLSQIRKLVLLSP